MERAWAKLLKIRKQCLFQPWQAAVDTAAASSSIYSFNSGDSCSNKIMGGNSNILGIVSVSISGNIKRFRDRWKVNPD